ncbi:LysM peptidoglycan-binding domain-containing protein [Jiella sp. MQZ9-1]|uniref:LysM peptidoglycan-binding domain-containing protein n=1 Tax=Jiella flava TaxID=2816857 RepID=A0A939FYE5_9HYPH|nr:LysM peptidoglycan-binding domain-containing protein [Jiella flava]MBO0661649.1 LysM peptidoglycan-binding domain-containing protein [Jiella flava]MCD2470291.1 LysM peptidoglycan-binding domain-containing protein [Jiella flava]
MQRRALGIVLFCLVLLVAIVAGYWDMLNSEKLRIAERERSATTLPKDGGGVPSEAVGTMATPKGDRPAVDKKIAGTDQASKSDRPSATLNGPGGSPDSSRVVAKTPAHGVISAPDAEQPGTAASMATAAPNKPDATARPTEIGKADISSNSTPPPSATGPSSAPSATPKSAAPAAAGAPSDTTATAEGSALGGSETATPPAAASNATPAAPAEQPTAADRAAADPSGTPRFDVLRVEPDGSTLVAGRSAPGSTVTLRDGDKTLGSDKADSAGDFVIVLDKPLEPGDHAIKIQADKDNTAKVSKETAVVSVPKDGKGDELLAMIEKPGEASRLIDLPKSETASASGDNAKPDQAAGAPAAAESATPPAVTAKAEPKAGAGQPGAVDQNNPLHVEAVEIDEGKIFVAGTAKPGARFRLYIDNKPFAEGQADGKGRFVVSTKHDLGVGQHMIRIDELNGSGDVVARVEVPFFRPEGRSLAAVAENADGAAPAAPPSASTGEAMSDTGPQSEPKVGAAPAEASGAQPAETGAGSTPSAGVSVAQPSTEAAPGDKTDRFPVRRQAALTASKSSRVIIRKGDSLWRISRDTYGEGSRYTVIYLANGDQIRNPNLIYPGQVFRMPDEQTNTEGAVTAD